MSGSGFPQSKALKRGYRLGDFVIQSQVARDEFRIIYLARDTTLGSQVTIEEYFPFSIAQRENLPNVELQSPEQKFTYRRGLNSFLKTAQILSKIKHANIVRGLSVFEENNTAYMVTKHEEGESLPEFLIIFGTLSQASLVRMFFPLLAGLERIHEQGLIHGAINPLNIRVLRNGSAILLNFCSEMDETLPNSQRLSSRASANYTALEQTRPEHGNTGPWTDIYSLAATFYNAITGTDPEDAISRLDRSANGQLDETIKLPRGVQSTYNKRFLTTIEHALILKPEHRPQSIRAWLKMFREIDSAEQSDSGLDKPEISANRGLNDDGLTESSKASRNLAELKRKIAALDQTSEPAKKDNLPVLNQSSQQKDNTTTENQVSYLQQHKRVIIAASIFILVFGWIKVSEKMNSPGSDANDVAQVQDVVLFDTPLPGDEQSDSARSLAELIDSEPYFPPVEGLDRSDWAGKQCSDCHVWTREELCAQGQIYVASDVTSVSKSEHPFGGFFKQGLKQWAIGQCG